MPLLAGALAPRGKVVRGHGCLYIHNRGQGHNNLNKNCNQILFIYKHKFLPHDCLQVVAVKLARTSPLHPG